MDSGYDGTQQMACWLLEIDSVGRNSCCSSVVCHTGFRRAGAGSWGRGCPSLCIFPNASGPAGSQHVADLSLILLCCFDLKTV